MLATALFSMENLGHLGVLIFLQAVLGFDNLLYISLESQRAPEEKQQYVRRMGILIAIVLRILLLFVMIKALEHLEATWFSLKWEGVITGDFTFATLVFLLGGSFIMYTAVKEITHMLSVHDLGQAVVQKPKGNVNMVIAMIVIMNLVFSFDSILSALAITEVFPVLATAIVISGVAMLFLSDIVSAFLAKNRQYEVLGMFILLIVGVVLLGEGGHEAHMHLFGYEVIPMSKSTFYFSLSVLVVVDVFQSKYQSKLDIERQNQSKPSDNSTTV